MIKVKALLSQPEVIDLSCEQPTKNEFAENRITNQLLLCSNLGIPIPVDSLMRDTSRSTSEGIHAKRWCHFCGEQVDKDLVMGGVALRDGSFIEHLASSDHAEQCDIFWQIHAVGRNHRAYKTEEFILSENEVTDFKVTAARAIKEREELVSKNVKKEADKLKHQDICRQRSTWCHTEMHKEKRRQEEAPSPRQQVDQSHTSSGFRTIAAKGEGLTCISLKNVDDSVRNVHSGAAPPWLTTTEDEKTCDKNNLSASNIGPSMDDFEKHLEAVKKGKLPPERVGGSTGVADPYTGANWLPSFGRVWSKSARTHIRKQFMAKGPKNRLPNVRPHSVQGTEFGHQESIGNHHGVKCHRSALTPTSAVEFGHASNGQTSYQGSFSAPSIANSSGAKGYVPKSKRTAEQHSQLHAQPKPPHGQWTDPYRHWSHSSGYHEQRLKRPNYEHQGSYKRIKISSKFL